MDSKVSIVFFLENKNLISNRFFQAECQQKFFLVGSKFFISNFELTHVKALKGDVSHCRTNRYEPAKNFFSISELARLS